MAGDPAIYRFLTGEDTPEFCARVSAALMKATFFMVIRLCHAGRRIVGQAVIWGQSRRERYGKRGPKMSKDTSWHRDTH